MSQSIIYLSRRAFIGGAAALGATSLIIPEFAFAETAAEKQAEADAVRNQLVGLQADLETAGENYYAALDEQESAQRSMEEQQVKIDETTEEIEGLQDRLSTRARSMYRSGSTTFIDFQLGASSFAEFSQNWELLNQINANDADLVDQTKAAREQLQAAKDEFARQEQIAAQKAAECKQIHDEVQVKVQNATDLMNSLDEEARALLEQAQAAAAACIDDAVFLERVYKENRAGVETLETFFKEQEIRYLPTTANFVLAQTGPKTAELNTELLKRGVIVRPVKSYGLPDWLRVSVGTARENARFIEAFQAARKALGLI